jgi:hypothetical protein
MRTIFIMDKVKDESVMASITVEEGVSNRLVLCRDYHCAQVNAFYLPMVLLELEPGVPCPEGVLSLSLDDEIALEEPLEFFLQPPELEKYPWKTIKQGLPAVVALSETSADQNRVIGFILANATAIEVSLKNIVAKQKTTLKIRIPLAQYTTRKGKEE